MLIIINVYKIWKYYFTKTAQEVKILSDYKNLVYFKITKKLNRRQVRWSEELAKFNFRIKYITGKENVKVNVLSRWPDYIKEQETELRTILKQDKDDLVYNYFVTFTIK